MSAAKSVDGLVVLVVDPSLRRFLPRATRAEEVRVSHDGTSTRGHVVQSAGIPLTEVGRLTVGERDVTPSHRPAAEEQLRVHAKPRPQPLPEGGFVLDVHLGSLARRLRLLGVDTAYSATADDDQLVVTSLREQRTLLTQDRGLLRRTAIRDRAAYVSGRGVEEQITDVLDRFALTLTPLSRCVACNGMLQPVDKHQVLDRLEAGTRRSYEEFAQCETCDRPYWRGAHWPRLEAVISGLCLPVPPPWTGDSVTG